MGIPAEEQGGDWWAVDLLFLDQDAVPTFVEVKRAADARTRREVVAQMLDYAANAQRYWPVERLREAYARRCTEAGLDPALELSQFLDGGDVEAFWEQARQNLAGGRVRLLFVADAIPPSLRTIIEFLNRQMAPIEVLGVEVKQFAGGGADHRLQALVPRVIGQTEQARQSKPARTAARQSPKPCTADEFEMTASDAMKKAVRELMPRARAVGMVERFLRGEARCYVHFIVQGVDKPPVAIYDHPPVIYINLQVDPRLEAISGELRQLAHEADPVSESAQNNSTKKSVVMSIDRITTPAQWDTVGRILDLIARTLAPQGPVAQ